MDPMSARTAELAARQSSERRALAEQIPSGKLTELSGGAGTATLSVAVSLLLAAQRAGETTAWVQTRGGPLFPPDLALCGVDLAALVVVHVPPAQGAHALAKAAEILLRSGGFGMVVLDFFTLRPSDHAAWQGRLLSLARAHKSRVLCLTRASDEQGSLGPLVDIRIASHRRRTLPGLFVLTHRLLKNKSGKLTDLHDEPRQAPYGIW